MKKYTYEIYFASSKEVFVSDLEAQEFINQFNVGGVENKRGDTVWIPQQPLYIKQKDNNVKF